MGMGEYTDCIANSRVRTGGGGTGHVNGRNIGVILGQEGIGEPDTTEELMYGKGREQM